MYLSKGVGLLLVLVFLAASCLIAAKPAFSSVAVAEDTWAAKAPMQRARAGLGVVAVNGKIYAIGGTTASGAYPPDEFYGGFVGTNEEYDPETDTWTTKAPMPTPRDYFAIATYQNKIYCIGGTVGYKVDQWGLFYSGIASGVNEVYDPETDTWTTKKSMPYNGSHLRAEVVNGKIYVLQSSFLHVYDPATDVWQTEITRTPFIPNPSAGSAPALAVADNKIIVTGTYETGVGLSVREEQKVMIYDVNANSWSEGASGPSVVRVGSVAAAATVGVNALQRVYLLGYDVNHVYDPAADAWATAAAMPTSRLDFGVAVVNDILYAIGGYSITSRYDDVKPVAVNEQYTPVGYGVPPEIKILSPTNQLYNESSVSLVFTMNKPVNWTGYSLDGQDNVTLAGNTTLTELTSGLHNVTVYAKDEFNNTGASNTVSFTIAEEPFPAVPVAAASVAAIAVVGVGLLVYFKKRKR
jgi:hypothetical protein